MIMNDLCNLLQSLAPWIDEVYPNSLDPEKLDVTDETDALVVENNRTLDAYGNDTFNELKPSFNVTVFYSKDITVERLGGSADKAEVVLWQALNDHGWYVSGIQHYHDPDTDQPIVAFVVTKNINVNELT